MPHDRIGERIEPRFRFEDYCALPARQRLRSNAYFIIRTEQEADLYGVNASQQPDGFARAALKLADYRKLAPGALEEAVLFDHPSGRTRILTAMRWKAEHPETWAREEEPKALGPRDVLHRRAQVPARGRERPARSPTARRRRALPRPAAAELEPMTADPRDLMPDARDGLTRLERVILWQLGLAQAERPGRGVPTALLYGRVAEHVDVPPEDFQRALARLVGRGALPDQRRQRREGRRR